MSVDIDWEEVCKRCDFVNDCDSEFSEHTSQYCEDALEMYLAEEEDDDV